MHLVVAGASGLIGTALRESALAAGHSVTQLVRRDPVSAHESAWDPASGAIDERVIEQADVVVNLAGASIGDKRLTPSYAHVVLTSRTETTHVIASTLAEVNPQARLLQGSSIGIYGDGIGRKLNERSRLGTTLLAGIATEWEKSAYPALAAGVPTVFLRTGLVLAPTGGFAARLLPLIRMGLIRRFGSGTQWMSWISLRDTVRAILFMVEADYVGPVNLCAPSAARNEEVIRELARAAGRPALFPAPAWAIRLATGPAADDILASQRGVPGVLSRLGFEFTHPRIQDAAAWVMREGATAQ